MSANAEVNIAKGSTEPGDGKLHFREYLAEEKSTLEIKIEDTLEIDFFFAFRVSEASVFSGKKETTAHKSASRPERKPEDEVDGQLG